MTAPRSLVDDARRLAAGLDRQGDGPYKSVGRQMICLVCQRDLAQTSHAPNCAWLVLPRIIRALEVGNLMADRMASQLYCNGCGATADTIDLLNGAQYHDPTCERWQFIAALRGDDPDGKTT